ncbi:MAG: hypothetical protein OCD76_13430 [Reichenbachiella sp.]
MKKNKPSKPKVNPELDGFEMSINSFGEIKSSIKIDKINAFLNKNVDDKKLKGREDIKDQNSDLDE